MTVINLDELENLAQDPQNTIFLYGPNPSSRIIHNRITKYPNIIKGDLSGKWYSALLRKYNVPATTDDLYKEDARHTLLFNRIEKSYLQANSARIAALRGDGAARLTTAFECIIGAVLFHKAIMKNKDTAINTKIVFAIKGDEPFFKLDDEEISVSGFEIQILLELLSAGIKLPEIYILTNGYSLQIIHIARKLVHALKSALLAEG